MRGLMCGLCHVLLPDVARVEARAQRLLARGDPLRRRVAKVRLRPHDAAVAQAHRDHAQVVARDEPELA